MGALHVNERDIVVPGQELAEGMDYLPSGGALREGDKIIASRIGLVNINGRIIKIIPLNGRYKPRASDIVIGKVADMTSNNWFVDIDCYNDAILSLRETNDFIELGSDLSQYFASGDYIVAKVMNVARGTFELSMKGPGLRKLGKGKIIKAHSSRVPRIIGKQGSMITLIKEKTGCRITVGQNGIVWIQGEPDNEFVAADAIQHINDHCFEEGLTDKIAAFLEERMKHLPPLITEHKEEHTFQQPMKGGAEE